MLGLLMQGEPYGVVSGGVACMQRSDNIDLGWQAIGDNRISYRQIQEGHAWKPQSLSQIDCAFNQFFTGFNSVQMRLIFQLLEEQVIQNESQIRFTRTMVYQRDAITALLQVFKQRFDKLKQVVHLLELATAILIHLAVARKDVQRLQQLNRLFR